MPQALKIEQLRKTYTGGVEALKGVDLKVEQGEFFALLGPNGAGKSTLIGILTGLVNKTSGKVRVFEEDLDVSPERVKAQLGVMTQELNFNIFESCWNTVNLQAGYYGIDWKEASRRTEQLLRDLELWEKAQQPVRNLSGGMKRRLMLARALVHDPKVLILDEPTAGLDIELRRSLWVYLQKRNEAGLTIILTTHYLEEAEALCNRVAIIDQGIILRDAPTRDLLGQLKKQTFVLELAESGPLPADDQEIQYREVDPLTLEADVSHGITMNEVFERLGQAQVKVQSMRTKANRLEELFIDLVGKKGKGLSV
ncbi:MAG: ABC transporter ATP-binding protein [Vulcanimicrobiota bacterium]